MIHSYNQFHAAGHGTFFSGQLIFEEENNQRFLWVYDCGSKRPGRLDSLIDDLHHHASNNVIDMLCLSHFDSDHVNGLRDLLGKFFVKVLMLPYLPFNRRLEISCELDIDVHGSTDSMLFTLDPAGYLAERGLSDRVESIVFVHGDGDQEEGIPGYSPLIRNAVPLPVSQNNVPLSVDTMSHRNPFKVRELWEFYFYNKDLPKGVASRTKATLGEIQDEVVDILAKWDLFSGQPKDTEGWRDDLRACYDRHFGATSKRRNDISLCVLSRPLNAKTRPEACERFDPTTTKLGCAHTLVPLSKHGKTGVLLSGDISLGGKELEKLRGHFGKARWEGVYLMQIPHHGSADSWRVGNASSCKHNYSVFCVPDSDPAGKHPHPRVLHDLKDMHPLFANYSTDVVFSFHVNQ